MSPDFDKVLTHLAATLLVEIAPMIPVDYAQKNTQLAAMLLSAGVEEWDRAVERRVDENRALRALFLDALPVVADPDLRRSLEAASVATETSLRVSALNHENDTLRSLLIDLHTHVETLETDAARQIEAAIWTELKTSTDRRALSISPF